VCDDVADVCLQVGVLLTKTVVARQSGAMIFPGETNKDCTRTFSWGNSNPPQDHHTREHSAHACAAVCAEFCAAF